MMKNILLNPGPTNLSNEVREVLTMPDYCHREPLVVKKYKEVTQKLVEVFDCKDTHDAILFVSSGTGCNEAMINGIQGKVLLLNNGKYSQRLGEITSVYNIPYVNYLIGDYSNFDIDEIENILVKDDKISHIMLTHHETTTGVIAPLESIGKLALRYNKFVIVDAISSLGAHEFNFKSNNITLCTLSANKCLESIPGLAIVFGEKTYLSKLEGKAKNFYFDLHAQWKQSLNGENRFTIPVQTLFALDKALDLLIREGIENRIKRYRELYIYFKIGLQKLGYKIIPQPISMESNYLLRINIPHELSFNEIQLYLKQYNVTIYAPKDILIENHFLLAAMGAINKENIDEILDLFNKLKLKYKIK